MEKCKTKKGITTLTRWSKHISVFTLAREYVHNLEPYFTDNELVELRERIKKRDPIVFSAPLLKERLDHLYMGGLPDLRQVRTILQFTALGKKFPFEGQETGCVENALQRFFESEDQCALTNKRLKKDLVSITDKNLLERVRKIIASTIGTGPQPDIMSQANLNFGPGGVEQSHHRSMGETTEFFKLSDPLCCNRESRDYLYALLSSHPTVMESLRIRYNIPKLACLQDELKILTRHVDHTYSHNRITFVPKSMETHRTIAVEPSGLIPLQMILGSSLRKALKRVGVNLDTQQKNRFLARTAKTMGLATLDLAMASDTLSFETVKALLPPRWFTLFNTFRSEYGECKHSLGRFSVKYEKFSSMGNGFTFELESLIFWAIAKATVQLSGDQGVNTKDYIAVFGDDIIIPKPYAKQCILNLEYFGFLVNHDKSFTSGLFFESCGADFYDSSPVRPFFLKREVRSVSDYNFILNSLKILVIKQRRSDLQGIYNLILRNLPYRFRLPIPIHLNISKDAFGHDKHEQMEAGLFCLEEEIPCGNKYVFWDTRIFAWSFKTLQTQTWYASKTENSGDYNDHIVRYLLFLRGHLGGRITLRGASQRRVKRRVSSQWDGLLTPDMKYFARSFDCI